MDSQHIIIERVLGQQLDENQQLQDEIKLIKNSIQDMGKQTECFRIQMSLLSAKEEQYDAMIKSMSKCQGELQRLKVISQDVAEKQMEGEVTRRKSGRQHNLAWSYQLEQDSETKIPVGRGSKSKFCIII